MKISPRTLSILKNFSTINPSIVIKKGNVISTISKEKNVLAEAEVDEKFPRSEFGIFELNKFLGVVSLFDENADFDFGEKSVVISDGSKTRAATYVYTDSSMIAHTDRKVPFPKPEVQLSLKNEDIQRVLKASSVMDLPNVAITTTADRKIEMVIFDASEGSKSFGQYSLDLGTADTEATEFRYVFKCELLKMLPGDYSVHLSNNIGKFIGTDRLEYYIAVEDK